MVTAIRNYQSSLPLSRNFRPLGIVDGTFSYDSGVATGEGGFAVEIVAGSHALLSEPWGIYLDVTAGTIDIDPIGDIALTNTVLLFRGDDSTAYEDVRSWTSRDSGFVGDPGVVFEDLLAGAASRFNFDELVDGAISDVGFWGVEGVGYTMSKVEGGTDTTYNVATPTGTGIQYNLGDSHGNSGTPARHYNIETSNTAATIGTFFTIFKTDGLAASKMLFDIDEGLDDWGLQFRIESDGRMNFRTHRFSTDFELTSATEANGGIDVNDGDFHTMAFAKHVQPTLVSEDPSDVWRLWIDGVRQDTNANITEVNDSFISTSQIWHDIWDGNSSFRQFFGSKRQSASELGGVTLDLFVYFDNDVKSDAEILALHDGSGV